MSVAGLLELFHSEKGTYKDERLRNAIRRVLDLQFKGIHPGFQLRCSKCTRREATNDCDPVYLTGLVDTTASPPVVTARLWHNLDYVCKDCRGAVNPAGGDDDAAATALDPSEAAADHKPTHSAGRAAEPSAAEPQQPQPPDPSAQNSSRQPSRKPQLPLAPTSLAALVAAAAAPAAAAVGALTAIKPPRPQSRRVSAPAPGLQADGSTKDGGATAGKGSAGGSDAANARDAGAAPGPDPSSRQRSSDRATAGEPVQQQAETTSSSENTKDQKPATGTVVGGAEAGGAGDDDVAAAEPDGAAAAAPGPAAPAAMTASGSGEGVVLLEYFEACSGPVQGKTVHLADVDVKITKNYLVSVSLGGRSAATGELAAAAAAGAAGPSAQASAAEAPAAAKVPPFLVTNAERAAELAEQLSDQLSAEDVERLRSLDFSVPSAAVKTLSHTMLAVADWVLSPPALEFAPPVTPAANSGRVTKRYSGVGASDITAAMSAAAAALPPAVVEALTLAAQLRPWAFAVRENDDIKMCGNCLRPSLMCLGGRGVGKPPTSLLEVVNAQPLRFSLAREVLVRQDKPLGSLVGLAATLAPVTSGSAPGGSAAATSGASRGAFKIRCGHVLPLQRLVALLRRRNKMEDSGVWKLSTQSLKARLEDLLEGDAAYDVARQGQQRAAAVEGGGAEGDGGERGASPAAAGTPSVEVSPVECFLRDLGATAHQVQEVLRMVEVDRNVGFCVECGDVGDLVACDSCVDSFCIECLGGIDPEELPDVWRCRYCQPLFSQDAVMAAVKAVPGALPGYGHAGTGYIKQEPGVTQSGAPLEEGEDEDSQREVSYQGDGEQEEEEDVFDDELPRGRKAAVTADGTTRGLPEAVRGGTKRSRSAQVVVVVPGGGLRVAAAGTGPRKAAKLAQATGGPGRSGAGQDASPSTRGDEGLGGGGVDVRDEVAAGGGSAAKRSRKRSKVVLTDDEDQTMQDAMEVDGDGAEPAQAGPAHPGTESHPPRGRPVQEGAEEYDDDDFRSADSGPHGASQPLESGDGGGYGAAAGTAADSPRSGGAGEGRIGRAAGKVIGKGGAPRRTGDVVASDRGRGKASSASGSEEEETEGEEEEEGEGTDGAAGPSRRKRQIGRRRRDEDFKPSQGTQDGEDGDEEEDDFISSGSGSEEADEEDKDEAGPLPGQGSYGLRTAAAGKRSAAAAANADARYRSSGSSSDDSDVQVVGEVLQVLDSGRVRRGRGGRRRGRPRGRGRGRGRLPKAIAAGGRGGHPAGGQRGRPRGRPPGRTLQPAVDAYADWGGVVDATRPTGSGPMDDTDAAAALMMLNFAAVDATASRRDPTMQPPAAKQQQQEQQQQEHAPQDAADVAAAIVESTKLGDEPQTAADLPIAAGPGPDDAPSPVDAPADPVVPTAPSPSPSVAPPTAETLLKQESGTAAATAAAAEPATATDAAAQPTAAGVSDIPVAARAAAVDASGAVPQQGPTQGPAAPEQQDRQGEGRPQGQGQEQQARRPPAESKGHAPANGGSSARAPRPPPTAGAAGAAAAGRAASATAAAAALKKESGGSFSMDGALSKADGILAGFKVFEQAARHGVELQLLALWLQTLSEVLECCDEPVVQSTLKSCLNGLQVSFNVDAAMPEVEGMFRSIIKMLQDLVKTVSAQRHVS